jgi:hypothetical protein
MCYGSKEPDERKITNGWFASDRQKQDYDNWGRPTDKQRGQQRRDGGHGGKPPGRGSKGKRIFFRRLAWVIS